MTEPHPPALIALDWGTTSLRAYLLDDAGSIAARAEKPLGILQVPDGDFDRAFAATVAPFLAQKPGLTAIGCGMIGSRQGWLEAPYAACPAGLDELSRAMASLTASDGTAFHIVPGMSVVDADGVPDVMRGEETQILGQFGPGESGVAVLPGTHSKWALVENGRIARFATFMTGEAFAAMRGHTILGRLMREGAAPDAAGFARGLDHAARPQPGRGGLLHRLFSARTLGLFDQIAGDALPSYLSGLMIGAEVEEAIQYLGAAPSTVTVIGAPALAELYATALARRSIVARPGAPDVAVRGLMRIARAAGLL